MIRRKSSKLGTIFTVIFSAMAYFAYCRTSNSISLLSFLCLYVTVCASVRVRVLTHDLYYISRLQQLRADMDEYTALRGAPTVAVSALQQTNFPELKAKLLEIVRHQAPSHPPPPNGISSANTSSGVNTSTDDVANLYSFVQYICDAFLSLSLQSKTTTSATAISATSTDATSKTNATPPYEYKGRGTVLNMWSSKFDGKSMHVVVLDGWVSAMPLLRACVNY